MTYNQSYAKTVKPRYREAYNSELAIITRNKAQINLLKKAHKNYTLYKVKRVFKFVIIEL